MTNRDIAIMPRGPFSWAAAMDVFGHFPPVEHHARGMVRLLRLTFPLDGDFTPVGVALWDDAGIVRGEVSGTADLDAVTRQVARVFSLDHDGTAFPEVGERDPAIGRLTAALPGLRPVCFTSPYETAAWAILSGGISTKQASRIQDRIIAEHGHPINVGGADVRCFPSPERLLGIVDVAGLSGQKLERLKGVARAALAGRLDAARLRELGDVDGPASLLSIRGIGPFWSQGIYLRGCGIVDAFPNEPLSIAALGHLHGLGDRPSPAQIAELTERYRPFRMWVCFLLRVAAGRGLIDGVTGREGAIRRGRG
jgi:DNA-3-methyladenine glycosylase II